MCGFFAVLFSPVRGVSTQFVLTISGTVAPESPSPLSDSVSRSRKAMKGATKI